MLGYSFAGLLKALGSLAFKNDAALYPDVGEVRIYADNTNPNTKYPNTTWTMIANGQSIRGCAIDYSDINTVVGADSIVLTADQMPSHNHSYSATTSAFDYGSPTTSTFDYGTRTTDSQGAHQHISGIRTDGGKGAYGDASVASGQRAEGTSSSGTASPWTDSEGVHAHNLGIGAHNHTVGIGAHSHTISGLTDLSGTGGGVQTLPSTIHLAIWLRTA